jgi:hypothetical protein
MSPRRNVVAVAGVLTLRGSGFFVRQPPRPAFSDTQLPTIRSFWETLPYPAILGVWTKGSSHEHECDDEDADAQLEDPPAPEWTAFLGYGRRETPSGQVKLDAVNRPERQHDQL